MPGTYLWGTFIVAGFNPEFNHADGQFDLISGCFSSEWECARSPFEITKCQSEGQVEVCSFAKRVQVSIWYIHRPLSKDVGTPLRLRYALYNYTQRAQYAFVKEHTLTSHKDS